MTIRIFAIEGRPLGDQQHVTCAALASQAVGPTIATAAQQLQQQITTLWTQQVADLSVQVTVSPMRDVATIRAFFVLVKNPLHTEVKSGMIYP